MKHYGQERVSIPISDAVDRHDWWKPKSRIPHTQILSFRLRGQERPQRRNLHGKYRFVIDDSHLHFVDPFGFGVVESYPIREIAEIEIFAAEESC